MGQDLQGEKSLIFLPIAHLSPVCAYRVKQVVASAEFDTLFVELPKEAQDLLPALTDRRTKLPVSLLFRDDKAELVLPLTEYSPEIVAVKAAFERGKRIVFFDSAAFCGAMARSDAAASAIEEFTGDVFDGAEFFDQMDGLAANFAGADAVTEREAHMSKMIEKTEYTRGIVVAGAIHCVKLKSAARAIVTSRPWEGKHYIIPYIPEGGSVLHYGYNAMLYQRLGSSSEPFLDAAADCLLKQAARVTADYPFEHVPVTDIIHTLVHMRMLAELRGKRFAGFNELIESAQSVIGKGDVQSVRQHAFQAVAEHIPEGELAPGFATPLAEDFERCLKAYSIRGEIDSRITLQILENPVHREKSAFLRRVELLIGDGFATFESGADYARGKDLNKVREVWRTRGVAHAVSRLTYVSYLGATVKEAAQRKIDGMLGEEENADAPQLSVIYIQSYFLRLDDGAAFERLSESIFHIGDFEAAVSALANLTYLIEVKRIFEGRRAERDVVAARSVYAKALDLLPGLWLSEAGEKNAAAVAKFYNIVKATDYLEEERLLDVLSAAPSYAEPCLCGCICAITGRGGVADRLENYTASAADAADAAMFFLGCAIGDRGLITGKRFIEIAAKFIESLTREEFMNASPALRYAFSFLKLTERNEVRGIVGELYGESEPLFYADESLLLKDEYLARQIELYGLMGERK